MRTAITHGLMAVAAAAATAGLLLGAQSLYNASAVARPLAAAIRAVPGVSRVQVDGPGGAPVLKIWLTSRAPLATTYERVSATAAARLGQPPAIQLQSNPDAAEVKAANFIQFIVAQGQATGRYVAMDRAVMTTARQSHLAATFVLRQNTMYLTLSDGSGSRWLQIAPLRKGE